jgi:hypothetical protein
LQWLSCVVQAAFSLALSTACSDASALIERHITCVEDV